MRFCSCHMLSLREALHMMERLCVCLHTKTLLFLSLFKIASSLTSLYTNYRNDPCAVALPALTCGQESAGAFSKETHYTARTKNTATNFENTLEKFLSREKSHGRTENRFRDLLISRQRSVFFKIDGNNSSDCGRSRPLRARDCLPSVGLMYTSRQTKVNNHRASLGVTNCQHVEFPRFCRL